MAYRGPLEPDDPPEPPAIAYRGVDPDPPLAPGEDPPLTPGGDPGDIGGGVGDPGDIGGGVGDPSDVPRFEPGDVPGDGDPSETGDVACKGDTWNLIPTPGAGPGMTVWRGAGKTGLG